MSVVRFLLSDAAGSLSGEKTAPIATPRDVPSRLFLPFVVAAALVAAAATFGLTRWLLPASVRPVTPASRT
jgi:hypothetical protein